VLEATLPADPESARRTVSPGDWLNRHWALVLGGLFALALLGRITVFELGEDRPNPDQQAYITLADSWAQSGDFARRGRPETDIAPLFPALHAVAIRLGASPQWSGRYLALLLSALVVPVAMWASRPILGQHAAVAAGLLIALHPRLLKTAEWIQPEHLTAALWLAFGGALWRRQRLLAGAALGLAYLSRPEAALVLPLWWLYELVVERRAWRHMLAATAVVLALALPYLLHLRSSVGEWVLTGKTEWVYKLAQLEVREGGQPASREELRRVLDDLPTLSMQMRHEPAAFLAGYGKRLLYAFDYLKDALGWPLFLLGWLGVGGTLWRDGETARLFLPLVLLLCIPVVVVHSRHVLPYVPMLLVAAVAAAQSVLRLARDRGVARMSP
jgi:4-amino-4-deoxy-L-arabinose transferase-like glycosyltransferase